jgi:hypothetical protein
MNISVQLRTHAPAWVYRLMTVVTRCLFTDARMRMSRVWSPTSPFVCAEFRSVEHHDIRSWTLRAGKHQTVDSGGKRVPEVFSEYLGGHVVDVFAAVEVDRQGEIVNEVVQEQDRVVATKGLLVEDAGNLGKLGQVDQAYFACGRELPGDGIPVRTVGSNIGDSCLDDDRRAGKGDIVGVPLRDFDTGILRAREFFAICRGRGWASGRRSE